MKAKNLFFAAALLCLVACNNKGNEPVAPGRQVTISATIKMPSGENAPIRKVSPDASSLSTSTITFHWEEGDKVLLCSNDFSEKQLFTIVDNSIDGSTANFTGTALTDMSSYRAYYLGKNTSSEKLAALVGEGTDSISYEANNFQPYVFGSGDATSFTLNTFMTVILVPLQGNATVGKIDYYYGGKDVVSTTMSFGTGLALTNTETPVYMTLFAVSEGGFILNIYDTEEQLLRTDTVKSDVLYDNNGKLVKFDALTANQPTKGKAKRKLAGGGEVDVDWVQLWAGGPRWATYNVSATTATEYGDYFCWGGSYANGEGKAYQDDHNTGSSDIQYGADDTAKKLWGENWEMPNKTDFDNLLANTTNEWIENYQSLGKNGRLFTGKGDYAENSIFLPAAGYCAFNGDIYGTGENGNYWSSSPNGTDAASSLFIMSSTCFTDDNNRNNAYSVRAILHEPAPSAPENVNLPNVNKTDGSW